MTRVSVVVDNHDYEGYVGCAVRSGLAQDGCDVEVVVVDDGSTDGSREVIDAYRDRVVRVYTPNRGQAAAFSAGLSASTGSVVLFLDADDVLLPTAARTAAEVFARSPGVVKVSWPMRVIGHDGRWTGATHPAGALPRGDLRELVLAQGADCYLSPPTSGNAWSRAFLEQVLPAPQEPFRRGADGYLITLAPLYGAVEAVDEPQSCYRLHDRNGYWRPSVEERVSGALVRHEARSRALAERLAQQGVQRTERTENPYLSWLRRLHAAVEEVRAALPAAGGRFLLLDGDEWGAPLLRDRAAVPFLERDGLPWGPPADDAAAGAELARQAEAGVEHVVVGWPAFWQLEHYPALRARLDPVRITPDVHVYRFTADASA